MTIYAIVPAEQVTNRLVNLSVHKNKDEVTALSDGNFLMEVEEGKSEDFLDFEWVDRERAETLIRQVPQVASTWGKIKSRILRQSSSEASMA